MKCPLCDNTDLVMAERQGVEIDYCPKCRGVWLDRGELDKILERSSAGQSHNTSPRYDERYEKKESHYTKPSHSGYHKKKENFFSELFDF